MKRLVVVGKDRMMAWGTKPPKPRADEAESVDTVAMRESP